MSKINLECIFCENEANYDFLCKHHLCKNCYKIDRICVICNVHVEIKEINHNNVYPFAIYPEYHQPSGFVNINNIFRSNNISF